MVRWILVLGLALLTTGFLSAVSVALGISNLPLLPVILLVAYLVVADSGLEGMLMTAALGLFLDAWAGYLLGINMLICLGLFIAGSPLGGWGSSPRGVAGFFLGAISAMTYTLIHGALFTIFGEGEGRLSLSTMLNAGFWNGILGVLLFPVIDQLFIYFGFSERELSLAERLSSRAAMDRRR